MLRSARIQKFAALPDAELHFSSGINVVVGENGLGKTQLLKLLYATLKINADARELTKTSLQKAYADKLVGVFRPDTLGRLVKRKQGKDRCEIGLTMADPERSCAFSFATGASVAVQVDEPPAAAPGSYASPVFIPTRELITLCPWFVALYDNYHLRFESSWRDTVSLLGAPSLKGPRERIVAELLAPLEQAMGGKVVVDTGTGEFYLQIPGEGKTEMPLVAEGLRKLAMLARLISTGVLLDQGYLFWDEPETNLNPKLIKTLAFAIVAVAASGVQVFIATHSLFLLRELEMLLAEKRHGKLGRRWFALAALGDTVVLEQSDRIEDIQTLVMLDEELAQSDRFMQVESEQCQ